MKEITLEWLEKKGACDSKLKKFKSVFGKRAKVSYKNAEIWVRESRYWKQDFEWLFYSLFTYETHRGDWKRELIDKLGQYISAPRLWSLTYWNLLDVSNTFFSMKKQRIIWGITQVVYMAK